MKISCIILALFVVNMDLVMVSILNAIHESLRPLSALLSLFRWYFLLTTICIVIVLLPLFLGLKFMNFSRTYEHQYGWITSLSYMTGENSAIIICVALSIISVFHVTVH